ncbi:ABC transporter permease [Propionibacteriaceae bacterium G1746]|uniref:ABC transporter permease n=1 Tax=Aestuariimicrobium sp. G57 TaxID=3418485 RepID=UPI003C2A463C
MSTLTTPVTAPARASSSTAGQGRTLDVSNLHTMLGINLRTGWRTLLGWWLAMVALAAITAQSMERTYPTPAEVRAYGETIGSGAAIQMMNGRIAGLDTLGGIFANEFGFIVSFVVPVMGIALVARSTRREEESGRLELLLASALGRHAPLAAALLITLGVALVTGLGVWASVLGTDIDVAGAAWYAAGIAAMIMLFGAVAAVAAQLAENTRGVWMIGVAIAIASYLVRGLSAVNDGWYGWLTPHGLFDGIKAFGGNPQWWPLAVLVAVSVVLVVVAAGLNASRDLGAAMWQARPGARHASAVLRSPWGIALHEHRGALIGWAVIAVVAMAIYGSLTQQVIEALQASPQLQIFVQAGLNSVVAMFVLLAAMLAAAAAIVLGGALRAAETSGRLEAELAGPRSRVGWISRHLVVISLGSVVILWLGAVMLAASANASLGDGQLWGPVMRAAAVHVPVVLAFSGASAAMFAWLPRWRGLVWAVYGVAVFLGYMGDALGVPDWLLDNSPFMLAGMVPTEPVRWAGVVVMSVIAVVGHVLAVVGMRHRSLPVV